jgi:hypothetical protein
MGNYQNEVDLIKGIFYCLNSTLLAFFFITHWLSLLTGAHMPVTSPPQHNHQVPTALMAPNNSFKNKISRQLPHALRFVLPAVAHSPSATIHLTGCHGCYL